MRGAKVIWGSLLVIILLTIAGFSSLYFITYDELIAYAIRSLQRADLSSALKNKYFTLRKFNTLKIISLFTIPALSLLLLILLIKRKGILIHIKHELCKLKQYASASLQCIKQSHNRTKLIFGILLLLLTIRSVYYALHFYAQYDECWNYNYFLSNTPLTTIVAWNNYPLHNIISYVFIKLLPDSTFVMRIPSIVFGLLSCMAIFVIIKKNWHSEVLALLGMALFAALPFNVFYFLYARGVIMAIFFGLILFYFLIVKGIQSQHVIILSICAALGTYAMISFPIYLCCIVLASVLISYIEKRRDIKYIIRFAMLATILSISFLSPFLIGSGISLGLESGYVNNSLSLSNIISHFELNAFLFMGYHSIAYIFISINILLFFLLKKERPILIACIALFSIDIFLPLVTQIVLPARALGFISIAYFFTFMTAFQFIKNKFNNKVVVAVASFFIISLSYIAHHHPFLNWSSLMDKDAYTISQRLQAYNIENIYNQTDQFNYYEPALKYYYKLNGKKLNNFTAMKQSTRYSPIIPLKTQAIILANDSSQQSLGKEIYQNNRIVIRKIE